MAGPWLSGTPRGQGRIEEPDPYEVSPSSYFTEDLPRRAKEAATGFLAGIPGAFGDITRLAGNLPSPMNLNPMAGRLLPTTEEIGEAMGADPTSMSFQGASLFSPNPLDKVAKLGAGAKALGMAAGGLGGRLAPR